MRSCSQSSSSLFFNDTATTEIYTLSLHDALPISEWEAERTRDSVTGRLGRPEEIAPTVVFLASEGATLMHGQTIHLNGDRKSTRLNSSHANISYAVFCLKQKIRHSCNNPISSATG